MDVDLGGEVPLTKRLFIGLAGMRGCWPSALNVPSTWVGDLQPFLKKLDQRLFGASGGRSWLTTALEFTVGHQIIGI